VNAGQDRAYFVFYVFFEVVVEYSDGALTLFAHGVTSIFAKKSGRWISSKKPMMSLLISSLAVS
jgi:hypothetical protein